MSLIRSSGNKDTELRLMAMLRAAGITGWRRGVSLRWKAGVKTKQESGGATKAFGVKPDFVFRARHLVVFVDGCFWHGCPKHVTWPRSNAAFWLEKLSRNRARDRKVNRLLKRAGWTVVRIWEHALAARHAGRTLARLKRRLDSSRDAATAQPRDPGFHSR